MVPPYRGAVVPKRFDHPPLGAFALWRLYNHHHVAFVVWRFDYPLSGDDGVARGIVVLPIATGRRR